MAAIRTCVGCRRTRPQPELVRFHLDEADRLTVGRSGPGRGAWLCADRLARCLTAADDRRAFARAFRRAPDPRSVAALRSEIDDEVTADESHPNRG